MPLPPEIQLGPHRIKVVTLSTRAEQAQGFQGYREIPQNYGLLFPGCGTQHFHMFTVGSPLLIVALDKAGVVVGMEVREPDTPGTPISTTRALPRPQDIFECHPIFHRYIHIGSELDASDRIQSRKAQTRPYGWWMDPTGKLLKTNNHEQEAWNLLNLPRPPRRKTYGDDNEATLKLLGKGYLRIVQRHDGSSLYFVEGTPSMAQRKALKQTAEDLGLAFYDGQSIRKIIYDGRDLQREAALSIPPKVLIQEIR